MAKEITQIRYRNRPKKKGHRRRGAPTISLATIAGFAPIAAHTFEGFKSGGFRGAADRLGYLTSGYSFVAGQWSMGGLMAGLFPLLIGYGAHKVAGRLGLNRALGKARIPFLRI